MRSISHGGDHCRGVIVEPFPEEEEDKLFVMDGDILQRRHYPILFVLEGEELPIPTVVQEFHEVSIALAEKRHEAMENRRKERRGQMQEKGVRWLTVALRPPGGKDEDP